MVDGEEWKSRRTLVQDLERELLKRGMNVVYRPGGEVCSEPYVGLDDKKRFVAVALRSTIETKYGMNFSNTPADFPIAVLARWENDTIKWDGFAIYAQDGIPSFSTFEASPEIMVNGVQIGKDQLPMEAFVDVVQGVRPITDDDKKFQKLPTVYNDRPR